MKKSLHLLITALLFVSAVQTLSATDYKYLILQAIEGTQYNVSVDKLKITFSGDVLTATQGETSETYSISSLNKMFFSENLSAIKSVEQTNTAISLDGSTLQIKAPAGTVARVFDTTGRMVMSTKIAADGTPANVNLLKLGVYTVQAGTYTQKILVK